MVDRYAHFVDEMRKDAAEKMNEILSIPWKARVGEDDSLTGNPATGNKKDPLF